MKTWRVLLLTAVTWLILVSTALAKDVGGSCFLHWYEPELPEHLKK